MSCADDRKTTEGSQRRARWSLPERTGHRTRLPAPRPGGRCQRGLVTAGIYRTGVVTGVLL